jgi:dipeptidyl aminopeptidase/acylaminoacyl peptidase
MKRLFSLVLLLISSLLSVDIAAQVDINYQMPPKEILELADAPLPPDINISRDGKNLVFTHRQRFVGIEELAEPEIRLAGIRINPVTNTASRAAYYNSVSIMKVGEKEPRTVKELPVNAKLSGFSWSPDQQKMAFTNTVENGTELWILDIATEQAIRLTGAILNGNLGRSFTWVPNSRELLVKTLPTDRKPLIDKALNIPAGPKVSVTTGSEAQNRTYADLLQDKADEFNFTQLTRSTLQKVTLDGQVKPWMEAAIYGNINFSPDGNYVLVTTYHEPYSYMVPYNRFPSKTTVFDSEARMVKVITENPLLEDLPKGRNSTMKGIRSISWRNDKPSTLTYVIALDEGDQSKEVEFRDEVFELPAPFTGEPRSMVKTINRFSGISWGNDNIALIYDSWWANRNTKTYLFNPSKPELKPEILFDLNSEDRYNDPGNFMTARNEWGEYVLDINNEFLYLSGAGHSEGGPRNFIDRYSLKTKKTERLWQAEGTDTYEQISFAIDIRKGIILTRIQSPAEYPNYFIRNITRKSPPQQITFFTNPYKSLENVYKELITYKRSDGVDLSAVLYLPPGYDRSSKQKLPMLMWAYPREFKDATSAGQVTTSPHQFISISSGSPLFWVMRGYAILDNAAFPIIGEGDNQPNDTFVEQLVANAKAAIDAVDAMGYIDPTRVAVGGHSYGAFMTANLLTHSNLFAAGIARSGAYNRTLTPFGFQNEERNYWESPEVYNTMSPFMNAHKMKTPILLIHGEADNNSGTFPMQSERYFNAIKGLGGTARLVVLPHESHGYAARESILHTLWETDNWLEKWVKNKK